MSTSTAALTQSTRKGWRELKNAVATGLIVAYQVKRVRALSLYYEHRPLP